MLLNLASLTYPGGLLVDYAPNALGQPTKAGTYATSVSYWPNGAINQFTYGNGIVHTLARNARGLPEESKDAYGTTNILYDAYDYDQVGNVAAISDGATGQAQRGNRTMTYDGLDRLTDVTSPMYGTAGAHYTYDVLDNLTRTVAVNRDQRLCYDQLNQMTNVKVGGDCSTGSTILGLGYDPQGNLANWNGVEYTFDYGNRLRKVEGLEAYRYDGHGRRVLAASMQGLGNILSMYSQAGQLLWQQDTRSSQWRDFIYLDGSLVAERAKAFSTGAATVTYQHTDALGTPVAKTNASRVVIQRSEYEPYGKLLNRPLENGPGYTGHVTDAATQLTYMQQRYYDPRVGRFWSVDPVTVDSVGGNFNRYWYANNNPYRFTDPDGRVPRGSPDLCRLQCDSHYVAGTDGGGKSGRADSAKEIEGREIAAQHVIDNVSHAVEGIVSKTPEESAELFITVFQPASTHLRLEFGANIVPSERSIEGWQIRNIAHSRSFSPTTGLGYDVIIRSVFGGNDVHTHPANGSKSKWFHPLSSSDVSIVNRFGVRSFLGVPNGSIYLLKPGTQPEKVK